MAEKEKKAKPVAAKKVKNENSVIATNNNNIKF